MTREELDKIKYSCMSKWVLEHVEETRSSPVAFYAGFDACRDILWTEIERLPGKLWVKEIELDRVNEE